MPKAQRIGRYELVTPLAAGGMGEVFVGRITGAGGFVRHVVVKTLDLGDDRVQQQAMFLDEARVLGRLHHQHIAPVFEIDEDKGKLFLVIDYVHGRTAQEVWQQARDLDSLLPLDFALTVIAHAAAGLHHAHTRTDDAGQPLDIVHRDVSLSNVMVGYDGAVKLIDFGIAKARDRRSTTQAGFVKGKLGYLAPEQVRQQAVDARTDVFALGICLYELTTMNRPFRDQSDRMTAERIKSGAYRKPSELVEGYPPELEQIVATALRVDPGERFATAEAMRRAIDAFGHRHGLMLGDTAIAEVMTQLFEDRREPWRRVARPETDLDIAHAETVDVEALDPRDIPPVPGKKMRSATEIVAALASELDHVERLPASELARAVVAVPTSEFDESVPTALARPPAVAVEEPASPEDRVRSIQRLFTESAFDARETPPKPLDGFGQTGAKTVVVDDPPRVLTNRGIVDVGATTDGVQIIPPTAVAPTPPPAPRKSRALLWVAVILIVLGGAGAAVYALMFASPGGERAADAAVAIADAAMPPPDAAPASPDAAVAVVDATAGDATRTVTLKLTSVPTGATVVLDGKRLGKTPFEATLPLPPGNHTLKLRRTGYNTVKVDLDSDLVKEVTLTKAKPKVEEPSETPRSDDPE